MWFELKIFSNERSLNRYLLFFFRKYSHIFPVIWINFLSHNVNRMHICGTLKRAQMRTAHALFTPIDKKNIFLQLSIINIWVITFFFQQYCWFFTKNNFIIHIETQKKQCAFCLPFGIFLFFISHERFALGL